MKTVPILTIVAASLLLARSAAATTSSVPLGPSTCIDAADPDAWLVKTGGFWKQGKRFGHFRVVVVRKGIEHATDWAQLQLIESDDQTQKRKAISCIDLHTPGVKGYARDITFAKATDKLTAINVMIEMKGMGDLTLEDVFLVSNDGKVSKLVEAKAVDLND
jgi:hypothetical protein